MAVDTKARKFSLKWQGGYLTTTQGVLEALYGADFMDKVGAGAAKKIAVKGHTRVRVIGQPGKTIAGYDYNEIQYPHRMRSRAGGGQPIKIFIDGSWWTARLGGSVQDFKQYLAGTGKPVKTFTFFTEKGTEYSSAA